MVLLFEHRAGRFGAAMDVVLHDLAHQPDEGQVERIPQRFVERGHARVVAAVEVAEAVHAATGEEIFVRVGREAPLHRRVEHLGQRRLRVRAQVVERPAPEPVGLGNGEGRQRVSRQCRQLRMQRGDEVEVGRQRAQLGGRAQFELGAGVDVEGLAEVVGVNAHPVDTVAAFEQREAVVQPRRVAPLEQALVGETGLARGLRLAQAVQRRRHGVLQCAVDRG